MLITFLGTSHGYAEKGRFVSATLVESGSYSYLIDAGAPVEGLMVNLGKEYADLRGIFITHMHSDHVGQLTAVLEPMTRFRYNDKATCFLPSEEGLEAVYAWLAALCTSRETIDKTTAMKVTHPGEIYADGIMKVLARPTQHLSYLNAPAYSYILEAEGKRVLFTGDMGAGFGEYPSLHAGEEFDLVVCEMAHSDIKNVASLLRETKTKQMIINHYHAPRLTGYEEIFASMPFPITLVTDGTAVEI